MANIYWVGGAGTWDTSSTTHWANSSGGTGGTGTVPTASDSVFFDSGSGSAGTVTMTGALTCFDITVSVTGWTFATGTSPTLAIFGGMSLSTGTTWSSTGTITFSSTTTGNTVTTNGVSIAAAINFNGAGGGWTLGSVLTVTSTSGITLTQGTFGTGANYAVTSPTFVSSGASTKVLNLNASTITVNSISTAWNFSTTTGLTLNAGTSTIVLSGVSGSTFSGGGLTYYNVTFNAAVGSSTTRTISGANTFNNLSLTSIVGGGYVTITIGASQTINGILTITAGTGVPGASRMYVSSSTYGTAITLTAASTSLVDIDFTDITGAGAASPFTGTRLGNCGGNSGITFTAAKNCYFVGTTSANWISTNWSLSSNGATSTANYPLPQDTAYFDDSSLNTSAQVNLSSNLNLPNIDFSARTNAMTMASAANTNIRFFGSVTLSSAVTITGTGTLNWQNRNTSTITNASVSWPQSITINNLTGSVKLLDAFTSTNATTALTLTSGTFDANGFNFTGVKVISTGTTTRTLAIGSGTWAISGVTTTSWSVASTGLTVTGSGTISMTGATAKTFSGGGVNYGSVVLNQGGAGALTVAGSNTFNNITASIASTSAASILFTAGTTTTLISGFDVDGTAANTIILSSATAGAHTLSLASGTVVANYLNISYSTATGGAVWLAPTTSVNGGNNTGWQFTAGSAVTSIGQGITIGRGVVFS